MRIDTFDVVRKRCLAKRSLPAPSFFAKISQVLCSSDNWVLSALFQVGVSPENSARAVPMRIRSNLSPSLFLVPFKEMMTAELRRLTPFACEKDEAVRNHITTIYHTANSRESKYSMTKTIPSAFLNIYFYIPIDKPDFRISRSTTAI